MSSRVSDSGPSVVVTWSARASKRATSLRAASTTQSIADSSDGCASSRSKYTSVVSGIGCREREGDRCYTAIDALERLIYVQFNRVYA
eukprot:5789-Heterococcus_DN1.PRE.1